MAGESERPRARYGMTIAAQWQSYAALIPKGASEEQRTETRRAFYAGVQGLLEIMRHSISDDPEMTEQDEDLIERLDAELRQFVDAVLAGKA